MGSTSNDPISLSSGLHLSGSAGYMITDLYGVRGVLGFDTYNVPSMNDKSYMTRLNLEGVLNVAKLAGGFGSDKIGADFHAGFGWASHANPSYKETRDDWADPMVKGNDDMFNISFGLTPKYILNDKISVNLDITYVLLLKKNFTNDWYSGVPADGNKDGILNTSVGVTYKF
jgi:hypothetical protein